MSKVKEMERTYLVQRLKMPLSRQSAALGESFSFGGGLKNGGLSNDAMSLIRDIFSFDYMGSAEFEFGAVPAVLEAIAKDAKNLRAFSFVIRHADIRKRWDDRTKKPAIGESIVYVICNKAWAVEVEARIRGLAKEGYGAQLKQGTRLETSLVPKEEWESDICGWLELDNGFFFFTDKLMWEQTCRLFDMRTPAQQIPSIAGKDD